MFHKYHLLNQLQVFMRYKKLPNWALISLQGKFYCIYIYIYTQCTNVYKQLICFGSSKFVEQFCKEWNVLKTVKFSTF